jgi:hypothetical protein
MAEFPLWDAYASRQQQLFRRTSIDGLAWGLEASLNKLLDEAAPVAEDGDLVRVCSNETRRTRHRRTLLIRYAAGRPNAADPVPALEARSELAALERALKPTLCTLLIAIGMGVSASEIAEEGGSTPSALRAQVSRARCAARAALGPRELKASRGHAE